MLANSPLFGDLESCNIGSTDKFFGEIRFNNLKIFFWCKPVQKGIFEKLVSPTNSIFGKPVVLEQTIGYPDFKLERSLENRFFSGKIRKKIKIG